ncbi:putative NAD(P)H-dependent glycerol-3-phosphate dehydrogenase [Clostridium botulinum]|uniref:NAD/NADP-dependent octopine/nopaline dehydrogenase family protein n=1 Tax=Clostridium botulinum TaxID=1491 RepID=UPI0005820624|nr:NAD/NADP-dependent octopine/nopaline dehydrogenase family protein [Clostridium botulinum]BAQ14353.1 putative NAD(P)H-dependent glycerol-3-phosphate dehydrogenase [Clostridium botulinum]
MNITIVGGGNIGSIFLAELQKHDDVVATMYTSTPEKWNLTMIASDIVTGEKYSVSGYKITNDEYEATQSADIILFTVPKNVFKEKLDKIGPYIKKETLIGIVPGTGGVEYYLSDFIERGYTIFGFDRTPYVSRVKEYGNKVRWSKKKISRIAAIPSTKGNEISKLFTNLLQMTIEPLKNYLSVTLTPSNPILHTSRLYAMFKNYKEGIFWSKNVLFYKEWDMESSRMLLQCDNELQGICSKIDKEALNGVLPLRIYYESENEEELTKKIRSIKSLQKIQSPMKKVEGGYVPDFNSRYFTEDIPYGLCIIKGLASVCDYSTPGIDLILKWYEEVSCKQYFIGDVFCGEDLEKAARPYYFGIKNIDDVRTFYKLTLKAN